MQNANQGFERLIHRCETFGAIYMTIYIKSKCNWLIKNMDIFSLTFLLRKCSLFTYSIRKPRYESPNPVSIIAANICGGIPTADKVFLTDALPPSLIKRNQRP